MPLPPHVIPDLRAGTATAATMTEAANEIERLQHFDETLARLGTQLDQADQTIGQLTDERDRKASELTQAVTDRARALNERAQAQRDLAQALNERQTDTAAARKDLIRRLIAVAISVGFASQIVTMQVVDWWGGAPNIKDPKETLARLVTALLVILLGWDWYDRDVEAKPLTRIVRFIFDAFIVVAELLLLLSASNAHLWSWLLAIVFASYFVWDILAIIDHPAAFDRPSPRPHWWNAGADILQTYWGGLSGEARKRGATINLGWIIYFAVVLLLLPFPTKHGAFVQCLMVAVGAWVLWCEGVRQDNGYIYFAVRGRLSAWALLLGGYGVYWYFFH